MKKIIALAVATAISAPAMADLTIGGSARYQVDNGAGTDTTTDTNRILLSVSGSSTAESGLFVSAGGTFELTGAGATGQDGDMAFTIGNDMANVVIGDAESAGVYTDGSGDQFRVGGTAAQGRVVGRTNENVLINVTAVEGLTAQFSTELNTDNNRLVLGYGFGGINASVGVDMGDEDNGGVDATQFNVNTSIAGATVGVSVADADETTATATEKSTAVYGSYMGLSVAFEAHELVDGTETDNWMASYSVANPGGLEGLTVTVGGADSDLATVEGANFGVRLDYAF